MTDTLENHNANTDPVIVEHRPDRLYRALAWVGIAAGSLFIVGAVFLSGYFLGQQSGGGGHHGPHAMMLRPFHGPDGPMGPPPPGGPMMGPDQGPRSERLTPPSAQSSTQPRP